MNKTFLLLLTGFAVGILLAPRKGSETWEMLVDKLDELKGEVTDEAEDVSEQAASLAAVASKKGKEVSRKYGKDDFGTRI